MFVNYRGLHTYEDEEGNEFTKWVYGYPIIDETTGRAYILNGVVEANDEYICIEDWREVKPETLGRYTGLTDKYRKAIYEGDIVNVHRFGYAGSDDGGVYETEKEEVGVMDYGWNREDLEYFGPIHLPEWLLRTKDREYYFSSLAGVHEESFEVLGNAHEDPEILEECNGN